MPTPTSRPLLGGCHQTTTRGGRVGRRMLQVRIRADACAEWYVFIPVASAEAGDQSAGTTGRSATFTHRVGERHQIVLVGIGRQRPEMSDEFPPARRGDAAGMSDAKVPGMGFPRGSEWPDDRRGVRVNERQRRYRIVRTPGPAAATGYVHERKAIARKRW